MDDKEIKLGGEVKINGEWYVVVDFDGEDPIVDVMRAEEHKAILPWIEDYRDPPPIQWVSENDLLGAFVYENGQVNRRKSAIHLNRILNKKIKG